MGTDQLPSPGGLVAMPSDRLWFDPIVLTANTYPQFTTVQIVTGVITPLAVPNPRRWGFGVFPSSPTTQIQYAPWPDIDAFTFNYPINNVPFNWFTLFTHGPLVCSGWWGLSTFPAIVRVVELLRIV